MEYMKNIPDNYFELAIVDPEYGISIANRKGSIGQKKGQGKLTSYTKKNWDNKPAGREYFTESFRVSQNQIIFGANYFAPFLPAAKGWVVWDKNSQKAYHLQWQNWLIHLLIKALRCSLAAEL